MQGHPTQPDEHGGPRAVDAASAPADAAAADRLRTVMAAGQIRALYQPVVDLSSGATIGYEALARGPAGTALERPDALFSLAAATGLGDELDRHCQRAALDGASELGTAALFVNVEPSSLGRPPSAGFEIGADGGAGGRRVVLEITERAVTAHPGDLLQAIGRARDRGYLIALDDLGADDAALALLPFIAPDVIKLDLRLIQDRPDADVARWVSAAFAESERSGATVLAEGIESVEHLDRARALGATLGQGWYFGRPAPLPATPPAGTWWPTPAPNDATTAGSPFDVVTAIRPARRSSKAMLTALSGHIEARSGGLASPGVLLTVLQDRVHVSTEMAERYARLAQACALTAIFGRGMDREPVTGVRGATIHPEDPLRREWSVLVIGAHEAAGLVARDVGDEGDELDRRFDFAVTHDRALVVRAARTLLARL